MCCVFVLLVCVCMCVCVCVCVCDSLKLGLIDTQTDTLKVIF